jgi:hypothetical protein
MDCNLSTLDQRQTFRCPVIGSDENAELIVGQQAVPVRLSDESAGGFCAWIRQTQGIACGDLLTLRTTDGCYEVRVVHVSEPATMPDIPLPEGAEPWALTPETRLGLQRVRDLDLRRERSSLRDIFQWLAAASTSSGMGMCITGIILALAVSAVPITILLAGHYPNHPLLKSIYRWTTHGVHDEPLPEVVLPQPGASQAPGAGGDSESANSLSPPAKTASGLNKASLAPLVRLPGATPLTLSEVSKALGLSEAQKRSIRRIAATTDEACRQLEAHTTGASRDQQSQHRTLLLEAARREALEQLTPAQRKVWNDLTR